MGSENITTITIPDYLNKEFFEQVLKNGLHLKNFKIYNWDVTMAAKAGDNFCSDVYRVIIFYGTEHSKTNKLSTVVKCIQYLGQRGPILDKFKVYDKERDMFIRILPKISQICHGESFSAKCYYTVKEPVQMIAFQDLCTLDYVMANRKIGIDFDHCSIVMRKLGKFHATSMIVAKCDQSIKDIYNFGLFHRSIEFSELQRESLQKSFKEIRCLVQSWPGYENIATKLEKLEDKILDKMHDCTDRENDSYFVLNHGDLGINNLLFKYDKETSKPIDVIFVDYQMNYYASPGLDLNYFIHTSPNNEVRDNHRDDMIQEYYKSFVSTLKELKYKNIPSYETLLEEIKQKEMFGLIASFIVLPIILMEKQAEEGGGIEGMMDEEISQKMKTIMFNGVNYQTSMKSILKRFDENKLLDS